MQQAIKSALTASRLRFLMSKMGFTVFSGAPIRRWPRWLGDLMGIQIPANVHQKVITSPEGGANINVLLDLFDRVASFRGDVAECGVFRGSTLITFGQYLRERHLGKRLFGLDSFEGFDSSVSVDLALGGASDTEKRAGGFGDASYDLVVSRVRLLGLEETVQIKKGFFRETLHKLPASEFCFVHLDCDIYQSYRDCLTYFYPRMVPDRIILLDEYNDSPWPGCNKAVDEFLHDKSERLEMIERDNYQKYFFTKL